MANKTENKAANRVFEGLADGTRMAIEASRVEHEALADVIVKATVSGTTLRGEVLDGFASFVGALPDATVADKAAFVVAVKGYGSWLREDSRVRLCKVRGEPTMNADASGKETVNKPEGFPSINTTVSQVQKVVLNTDADVLDAIIAADGVGFAAALAACPKAEPKVKKVDVAADETGFTATAPLDADAAMQMLAAMVNALFTRWPDRTLQTLTTLQAAHGNVTLPALVPADAPAEMTPEAKDDHTESKNARRAARRGARQAGTEATAGATA